MQSAFGSFNSTLDFEDSSDWMAFNKLFEDAFVLFGISELSYKKAERAAALNVYPDSVTFHTNFGQKYNMKGVEALTQCLAHLQAFNQSEIFATCPPNFFADLQEMKLDAFDFLIDLEFKVSDVVKVQEKIDEVISVINLQSGNNLLVYLEGKINELIIARQQPDRGNIDNIPLWKLIAVCVNLGVGTWAIYACRVRSRGCSTKAATIYRLIVAIAWEVFFFC